VLTPQDIILGILKSIQ